MKVSTPKVGEPETQEYPSHPSTKEVEFFQELGAKLEEGKWRLPDARELISKEYNRKILKRLHQQTHWGTKTLAEQFLKFFGCKGIYQLANQEVQGCMICQKVN